LGVSLTLLIIAQVLLQRRNHNKSGGS
jgi:hypothetical protein